MWYPSIISYINVHMFQCLQRQEAKLPQRGFRLRLLQLPLKGRSQIQDLHPHVTSSMVASGTAGSLNQTSDNPLYLMVTDCASLHLLVATHSSRNLSELTVTQVTRVGGRQSSSWCHASNLSCFTDASLQARSGTIAFQISHKVYRYEYL